MRFSNFELLRTARNFALLSVLTLLPSSFGMGQNCIAVKPTNGIVNFGSIAVGTSSSYDRVKFTNNCGVMVVVNSIAISAPEFLLDAGWTPIDKEPNGSFFYGLRFRPDSAQTFTGTLTVSGEGFNPISVTLTGTGFITQAASSFSSNAIAFGNQAVGSTSTVESVTITNTGTAAFNVESVYADPPFAVTGFSGQDTLLQPGNTLPLQVTFTPWDVLAYAATLVMTSDVLPPIGATLSGTGTPAPSLAVSTYPTLQWATQGFAYNMQLNSAGGTQPLNWSLAEGADLPLGLTLSSQGLISGIVDPSVPLGD
jgi:Abnormal spindle-like microcephaly-assoc'd, ASPM-SPD-2-Hydin